jgi:hypothetical protein
MLTQQGDVIFAARFTYDENRCRLVVGKAHRVDPTNTAGDPVHGPPFNVILIRRK